MVLFLGHDGKALLLVAKLLTIFHSTFTPGTVFVEDALFVIPVEIPIIFKRYANWFVTVFGRMTTATGTIVIKKGTSHEQTMMASRHVFLTDGVQAMGEISHNRGYRTLLLLHDRLAERYKHQRHRINGKLTTLVAFVIFD